MKRYNTRVPPLQNQSAHRREDHPKHQDDAHPHHHHAVYASETVGLLLIAGLLLILTLIRYWHYIHWSLR
jgi:hypothetical protein